MKAIRVKEFGGPEVLKLEEIARPAPGPGQILVRIMAAGVNPAEDPREVQDDQVILRHVAPRLRPGEGAGAEALEVLGLAVGRARQELLLHTVEPFDGCRHHRAFRGNLAVTTVDIRGAEIVPSAAA